MIGSSPYSNVLMSTMISMHPNKHTLPLTMYIEGSKGGVLEVHSNWAGKEEVVNSFCVALAYAAPRGSMKSSLV